MRRVIVALLGVAAGFAALVIWLGLPREGTGQTAAALGIFFGVMLAGFPVLYWCCKRHYWDGWRFVLIGSLAGGLCAVPFAGGPYAFGFLLMLFLVAGAVYGALFWLVAIFRNDALTCPKSFCLPCGKVYRVARNALGRTRGT
jgi:O-antigen/teichoic acid export membrane protein